MSTLSYHEQKDKENIIRLRGLIRDLPGFCADFFRGIEPRTLHEPELHMHMICIYFCISSIKKIRR